MVSDAAPLQGIANYGLVATLPRRPFPAIESSIERRPNVQEFTVYTVRALQVTSATGNSRAISLKAAAASGERIGAPAAGEMKQLGPGEHLSAPFSPDMPSKGPLPHASHLHLVKDCAKNDIYLRKLPGRSPDRCVVYGRFQHRNNVAHTRRISMLQASQMPL